jgi:Mrp family chromosome partitioning ATPase
MTSTKRSPESPATAAPAAEKRVILSMGGKGGVGKTSIWQAWRNGFTRTASR